MVLGQVFLQQSISLNLESDDKDELFEEMLELIETVQPTIDRQQALSCLRERENKMSTGIMRNIAIPHCSCKTVKGMVGAIGISKKGIDYNSLDGSPVHLVFMILSGPDETEKHLSLLKSLAAVLQNPLFMKEILETKSTQEVYDLVCKYENLITV